MSLYPSKAEAKRQIQALIDTNDKAVLRALAAIYASQTRAEQSIGGTHDANGVGFSGVDGEILSSFATFAARFGRLSDKQMVLARKKLRKYWNQLRVIAETNHEAKSI